MSKPVRKSKKFWSVIIGSGIAILNELFGEPLDEQALTQIEALILAFIVGTGMADWGKERKE